MHLNQSLKADFENLPSSLNPYLFSRFYSETFCHEHYRRLSFVFIKFISEEDISVVPDTDLNHDYNEDETIQVNFEHLFTSKEKCSILLRFDRLFRYLWKFSVAVWYCNDTYKSGLDIKTIATINHF